MDQTIIKNFEKAHFGTWENANTKATVIIKASKFGDYVEFNHSQIDLGTTETNEEGEEVNLQLADRYEIESFSCEVINDTYNYILVLKKFKEEVSLVLSINDKTLKICNAVSTNFESADLFSDESKCLFLKS